VRCAVQLSSREESQMKKSTSDDLARGYISSLSLRYVVLLLFWTGTQNWSINTWTPSALHDVMTWNTDNQKS